MPNIDPAPTFLIRTTLRPSYWRVAIVTPTGILWRTYSRDDYPTRESVITRARQAVPAGCHAMWMVWLWG